jgi:1-pyrroline-5-carboxylate dehydrogenase
MTDVAQSTFADRITEQRRATPVVVPHIVNGVERYDGPLLEREDPSAPGTIVSGCHDAPAALVDEAVAASQAAQKQWAKVPLAERIERVSRAIPYVEEHIEDWAVRVAVEVGKPYAAARAEGAEVLAILQQYTAYAGEPGAFDDARTPDPAGLAGDSVLKPYGVFGAITPFNYPIVQAAGPVVGALLAGNGVVVKTAHHGPWSGHAIHEFTEQMGLPTGLVNVIHGADDPGRALAGSDIDGVCFTGSVGVGQSIVREFAHGPYYRPVIAEMGGKNPVIVTDTADLEFAADGIVFSAFDLSGQKCSALSRVIVTPGAHEQLAGLIADRVATLRMTDPAHPDAFGGPVVSREAVARHQSLLEEATTEGFAVTTGITSDEDGYFVPAVVVDGVPADHRLSNVEHFLPFLTISEVPDFATALQVANQTTMGLTAGIYTGDRAEAEEFLDEIEAGCVNVNVPGHATTGWWPGPQTFGGWKGSGTTGKQTLGKWYFQQFAREQARKLPRELGSLLTY